MDQTLTETVEFTSPLALEKGMVLLGEKYAPETLKSLEKVIQKSLRSFWEAGRALDKIIREKLWFPLHPSSTQYLKVRWGFSRSRASHLIGAAKVVDLITTVTQAPSPKSERVVRPLVPLLTVPVADLKGLPDEEAAEVIAERTAEREALVVKIYSAAAKASRKKVPDSKDVEKQIQILAPEQRSKPRVDPESEQFVVEPRVRDRFVKYWTEFWENLQGEDLKTIWKLIDEQHGCLPPAIKMIETPAEVVSESTGSVGIETEVAQQITVEVVAPDGAAAPCAVPEPPAVPVSAKPEQEEVAPKPAAWEQMDLITVHPSAKPEAVAETPEVVPPAPVRNFEEFQASRENKPRQRKIRVRRAR